jgi:hypothetical protein
LTLEINLSPIVPILGTTTLTLVDPNHPDQPGTPAGFDLNEPLSQASLKMPPGMAVDFAMDLPDDVSQSVRYEVGIVGGSAEKPFAITLSHQRKEADLLMVANTLYWAKCPYRVRLLAPGHLILEKKPIRRPRRKHSSWSAGSSRRLPVIVEGEGKPWCPIPCVIL